MGYYFTHFVWILTTASGYLPMIISVKRLSDIENELATLGDSPLGIKHQWRILFLQLVLFMMPSINIFTWIAGTSRVK